MPRKPSPEVAAAWTRLSHVHRQLHVTIECELKRAGFPPLSWYGVLQELARAPHGAMRPIELERQVAMPQYGLSRLVERLVEAKFAERAQCPKDKRGLFVVITPSGREMHKKMSAAYAGLIERHVGSKLSDVEAARLTNLLNRLDHTGNGP
jgi:DNA-binding MarR family transcriptional regulator